MTTRRGFSLMEVVVAMAVLGVVILAMTMLTSEYRRYDRAVQFKWFVHPEIDAVMSRMRADVIEATGYPAEIDGYVQGEKVLILQTRDVTLHMEETVWDFRDAPRAKRLRYRGGEVAESWQANGLPDFTIAAAAMPDGSVGLRLQGKDGEGRVIVEQTLAPRAQ
ncbi:MAG: type IV pilus modification PilV family protein [Thermoanaerobaculia bacterium]